MSKIQSTHKVQNQPKHTKMFKIQSTHIKCRTNTEKPSMDMYSQKQIYTVPLESIGNFSKTNHKKGFVQNNFIKLVTEVLPDPYNLKGYMYKCRYRIVFVFISKVMLPKSTRYSISIDLRCLLNCQAQSEPEEKAENCSTEILSVYK